MPGGSRRSRLSLGGDEYAIVSAPVARPEALEALTSSERAILAAILEGRSNRDIARARGVAMSTVVNQIGVIYRKLGVQSRAEVMARCLGGPHR